MVVQYGEDTWEDQIVREYYIAYHRIGHHLWNYFLTLPGPRSALQLPASAPGNDLIRSFATNRKQLSDRLAFL